MCAHSIGPAEWGERQLIVKPSTPGSPARRFREQCSSFARSRIESCRSSSPPVSSQSHWAAAGRLPADAGRNSLRLPRYRRHPPPARFPQHLKTARRPRRAVFVCPGQGRGAGLALCAGAPEARASSPSARCAAILAPGSIRRGGLWSPLITKRTSRRTARAPAASCSTRALRHSHGHGQDRALHIGKRPGGCPPGRRLWFRPMRPFGRPLVRL